MGNRRHPSRAARPTRQIKIAPKPQPDTNANARDVSAGPSIPNCLYQYSTHSAFAGGAVLDGPKVSFLTGYGDYAYCLTPTGQPVMLEDSKAYTFDDNHKATAASPDTPLAFAMMCLFTPENRVVNPDGGDTIENLRETFKKGKFDYDGINNPVPFAVRGAFSSVKTTRGDLKGVQGTIFGFAVPAWMESLSGPGVRCCFLSGCRTIGGDVLEYSSTRGTFVEWAISDHLRLGFPRDDRFESMKLS